MASCPKGEKISAYHDGELPVGEAAEVERHLQRCAACRHELERLRALSEWFAGTVPAGEAPPALLDRLRRTIRPRRDRIVLRTAGTLTAVAAAVLIACSALLWQRWQAATPAGQPAAWEALAVTPTSVEADGSLAEETTETDADVQILRSILGDAADQNGDDHE